MLREAYGILTAGRYVTEMLKKFNRDSNVEIFLLIPAEIDHTIGSNQ